MRVRLKKLLRLTIGSALVLALMVIAGLLLAPRLLVVDSGADVASAVVVLGGESWTRAKRAAEVYHEIATLTSPTNRQPSTINSSVPVVRGPVVSGPVVVVSGNGDCQDVRRQMEAAGVPAIVIVTECESRSTYENAQFSVKLLRARGITNVVVVTSWYHSRRALATFRDTAPEIAFYSCPTIREAQKSWWPDRYERKRIIQEYAKIGYYWLAYGVGPWE